MQAVVITINMIQFLIMINLKTKKSSYKMFRIIQMIRNKFREIIKSNKKNIKNL